MKQTRGLVLVAVFLACFVVTPAFAQSGGDKQPPAQGGDKAAADPITGEWEGLVDMPDGPMPFGLSLKLDQGKVTGEIGSSAGLVAITEGTWADGKLTVRFTYVDGADVEMVGALSEGQFSGSLSYGGGQMVLNWIAKKKVAQ
jgi:hypothetical protein